MGHIDDVPAGVTAAGQAHDYQAPPPTLASVVLVNSPLPASHEHIGPNQAAYDAFIDGEVAASRAYTESGLNITNPEYDFGLSIDLDTASGFNYARLTIGARRWYMFVTASYANSNVTRFTPVLDEFPSYGPWQLGYSMVERGHAAVAASQSDTYGDQYCGEPEPVSAPPERGVQSVEVLSSDPSDWTLVVISANDLRGFNTATPYFDHHIVESDLAQAATRGYEAGVGPAGEQLPAGGGDHGFTPDLFETAYPWHDSGTSEFYVPVVKPSAVSTIDGIPQGGGAYLFTLAGWHAFIEIAQGASWIVEGITGYELVPSWSAPAGGGGTPTGNTPPTSPTAAAWNVAAGIPVFVDSVTTTGYDATFLEGWRDAYLGSVGASMFRKLITAAHVQVVVGDGESTNVYAPDQMPYGGVTVHAVTGAAHGEASIRLTVDYNELGDQQAVTMAAGGRPGAVASGYGRAASNTASAVLGPTNTAYGNYMNRRVMRFQNELAVILDQTQRQMNMGITGVQSVMQAGQGAALGALSGGKAGIPGAIVGALLGGGGSLVTAGLSSNNSLEMLDISQPASVDIGAFQLGASGAFSTMSFRTWVQGLKAGSGRGTPAGLASAWRAVTGQAFKIIIVGPSPARVRDLLATWKRYGYMIGRAFTPSRLDPMTHYSYWKTNGAVIVGAVPEAQRQKIAARFDAGVTVWPDISQIGTDQSGANTPRPGFTY